MEGTHSRYEVWEWRRLGPRRRDERRSTCQHLGCRRAAVWCLRWQTKPMPASAFWYRCNEHKALVEPY